MPRDRILTRKLEIVPGLCLLVDNGAPCPRPVLYRGICNAHVTYLRARNRIEEFALPHVDRKHTFVLAETPRPGACRIVDNGVPCDRRPTGSGICSYHIRTIRDRADLRIEDYFPPGYRQGHSRRPPSSEIAYLRQKTPAPGLCVVRERSGASRWAPCDEKAVSRGLCQKHRFRLLKAPALFDRIANPERHEPAFQLKRRLREGVCVIVEDGHGCESAPTRKRRVCDHHYHALARVGKLDELTRGFVEQELRLERKAAEGLVPGFCALVVNGVPCTNPAKRRGLCGRCLWVIERDALDLEVLADPVTERHVAALARAATLVPGRCLVASDGIACDVAARARGVCRQHYKALARRGLLETVALSREEVAAQAEIPHVYFDKNVVIRFAMHEVFGVTPDRSSVALVDAVLRGRLHATVSLDCVRAVYSHLGHRLARPRAEGGHELEEKEAESRARDYAGKLFFSRRGLWSFMAPTEAAIRACTAEGRLPHLSLEDALEVHLFAVARERHGAKIFVTADAGILEYGEAVHPERVVSSFGLVAGAARRR